MTVVNNYRINYLVVLEQSSSSKQLLKYLDFQTRFYMYLFDFFNDSTLV